MTYTSPKISDLGSVRDLTLAFNKVGLKPDIYSSATGGAVIGSLVNPG